MNIRTLIVDDEPLARDVIRTHLNDEPGIHLIGEAGDGPSAVEMVKTLEPEMLFLDVQLPGFDGFEVLERLSLHHVPAVVFVTAYERYALRAFEVHAIDYLLKPFTRERFGQAVQHVRGEITRLGALDSHKKLISLLDGRRRADGVQEWSESGGEPPKAFRLAVSHRGRTVLVDIADVDWIEANANYSTLHIGPKSYDLRCTMTELQARLAASGFVRIHRSTVVNVNRISDVIPCGHSDYDLVLSTGTVLKLSRHYRKDVVLADRCR
jgi:two-component system, LytTR family, response regulator